MREERPTETLGSRRASWLISAMTFLAGGLVPLEKVVLTAWSSDDVAWQVAFRTWRPGQSTVYLPPNLYVLRWPVLVGVDRLLPPTPAALYLVAFLLNGCGLLLVLWSARRTLAWARPTERLPPRSDLIASAVTISVLIAPRMIRHANEGISTRNFETGLYLALVVVACGWLTGRRRYPGGVGWVGVVVAIGLIGLNDPLGIYSVVVPTAVIAAVVAFVGPHRGHAMLALGCVLGVITWRLGMVLIGLLGVDQAPSATSPQFDEWGIRLRSLATVVLGGFGLSSYASLDRGDFVLAFVVGCGTVALVVYGVVAIRRGVVPTPAIAGVGWLAWVAVLYFMSESSVDPGTNRYVAVGFSGLVPIAAWSAAHVRRGELIAVGLAVVAIANPIVVAGEWGGRQHPPNRYELAHAIENTEAAPRVEVFATYFNAQITTYYGDGAFETVPIVCPGGTPTFFRWITDTTPLDRALEDGAPSLVVPGRGCEPDILVASFGEPDRVVPAGTNEIWVYGADLAAVVAG